MKLVVHVGSHKTGTSAIQAFCMTSKDEINRHGISYPTSLLDRYPGQHSDLYRLGFNNMESEMERFFERARSLAVEEGAGTVFLSGEDLCVANTGVAGRLMNAARKSFDDIYGVLVLRKKSSYLMSQYKYQMVEGRPVNLLDFSRRMRFSPRDSLDAWCSVLGPERMKVISYDKYRKEFIQAFFREVFGVEVRGNFKRLATANMSLDYVSAAFVNDIVKLSGNVDRRKIHSAYREAFGDFRPDLPIEELVSESLAVEYPDEQWIGPGLDGLNLLEKNEKKSDPGSFDFARYAACFEKFIHKLNN